MKPDLLYRNQQPLRLGNRKDADIIVVRQRRLMRLLARRTYQVLIDTAHREGHVLGWNLAHHDQGALVIRVVEQASGEIVLARIEARRIGLRRGGTSTTM